MTSLAQGIREAINMFGMEIITSDRLIGVLSDFRCFDFQGARPMLRTMVAERIMERIYYHALKMEQDNSAYIDLIVADVCAFGFQRIHAVYVVGCIAQALGWVQGTPEAPDEETVEPGGREVVKVGDVEIALRDVPGGRFAMGATPEQGLFANFDERPAVTVEVSSFKMMEAPVTQRIWSTVMEENPSHFRGDDLPVERVTFDEVQEFISRLNAKTGLQFRLPTETEWEYAARGGQSSKHTKYSGADDDHIELAVWYKNNSDGATHSVAEKEPNELGLYDMSGNVAEWCEDFYFNSYAARSTDKDPKGPADGATKVVRGGSWCDQASGCRTSRRESMSPTFRSKRVGFRMVLPIYY